MAASIRKFDDIHVGKHEVIEAKPNRDPIADAEQDLLEGAAEERAKAKEHNRLADDYERRAKLLRQTFPLESPGPAIEQPSGLVKLGDLRGMSTSVALEVYLSQTAKLSEGGKKLNAITVAEELARAGANLAENPRPGKRTQAGTPFPPGTSDYVKEAVRNIFITASRNRDRWGYDKKTYEIWRI